MGPRSRAVANAALVVGVAVLVLAAISVIVWALLESFEAVAR